MLVQLTPATGRPGAAAGAMLGVLLMLFALASQAQLDAYSAEVAVAERSDSEQQEAFDLAMREVLLANSGDKTVLNRDDIRAALREAESYVEQFRYRTPETGTLISRETPVTRAVLASGQATQLVLVRFDPARIDALIAADTPRTEEAGQAEVDRITSALVWMLIEDGPRILQVDGDRVINVQRRAREIAGGSGFTLRFPAGDSIDRQAIALADLQLLDPFDSSDTAVDPRFPGARPPSVESTAASPDGTTGTAESTTQALDAATASGAVRSIDTLRLASARYAQPMVVVAHLSRKPLRGWLGAWMRIVGDEVQQTQFDTDTLDAGLQRGIDWLVSSVGTDALATAGGGLPSAAAPATTEALIWVGSVDSTRSYADVLDFLSTIEGVDLVYPKEVSENGTLFAVTPRRALRQVTAALGSTDALRPAPPPSVDASGSAEGGATAQLWRNAELTLDYVQR